MFMFEVLLKAAEYVEQQEQQQQYNDAASSSSSSSSSDISGTLVSGGVNTSSSSNVNNASLSTSGYSSGGSSTSSSRYAANKSLLSQQQFDLQGKKFTNISNLTSSRNNSQQQTTTTTSSMTSKQGVTVTTTTTNTNVNTNTVPININTTRIKNEFNLPMPGSSRGEHRLSTSSTGSNRSGKYANVNALRIEEIKRDKAIHNTLEKNRRAHLKECFENLQNELPQYRDKKVTNLAILNYTLKYIQQLSKREKDYDYEKQRHEKRQLRLANQLNQLKNDLKNENIDYTAFIEDTPNEDETSTSTASEIEAHYQTSDNFDDEFDEDLGDISSFKKRKISRSSMSLGEDDFDDDDIDESEENDVETDDAYDYLSSSDNNARTEFINNLKRQKRFTRKRNKYTNESTDSISSDLTVENYHQDKCKVILNTKIHDLNKLECRNYLNNTTNVTSNQKLTQVTSSPATTSGMTQQQPQSSSPSATSTLANQQLKSLYLNNTTLNSTMLHKALNEKFQINTKYLNVNNVNANSNSSQSSNSNDSNYGYSSNTATAPQPITTTIISASNNTPSTFSGMFNNLSSNSDNIKTEPNDHLQQQQQQKLVKRTRSSRPATVNQLLSSHTTPAPTTITTIKTQPINLTSSKPSLSINNDQPTITLVNSSHNNNDGESAGTPTGLTGLSGNIKVIKCNKTVSSSSGDPTTIFIKHQTNLYVPSTTSVVTAQQQQNNASESTQPSSSQIIRNCLKSPAFANTSVYKPAIINTTASTTAVITPTVSQANTIQILNKPAAFKQEVKVEAAEQLK